MSSFMVAKKSSTQFRSDAALISRQPIAERRGVSWSDVVCNSPSLAETVFQSAKSESASGVVPSASVISHAFHSGRDATMRGRKEGKSVARVETIRNSWMFGSPTALNQRAEPFVSKRIKLKVGLAVSCRNWPVRRRFNGPVCC